VNTQPLDDYPVRGAPAAARGVDSERLATWEIWALGGPNKRDTILSGQIMSYFDLPQTPAK